jgi:uncharacterized protein
MIIDLASIGKSGKPIQVSLKSGEIDLGEGVRLTTDAEFAGDIWREQNKTYVRGRLMTSAEVDCFRCLEPVARKVDMQFEDVFVSAEGEPGGNEIEIDDAQLHESILTGSEIDLVDVIREQLILATTETVYCKEDCKGLCPKCGGNRNLIDCKCEENEIDPRWAALKNLN